MGAEERTLRVLAGLAMNGYDVLITADKDKLGAAADFYGPVPVKLLAVLIAHEFGFEEE